MSKSERGPAWEHRILMRQAFIPTYSIHSLEPGSEYVQRTLPLADLVRVQR
uniref:Uncharacterized protein n=1 Tax=Picea glauca TaxID=3330 RepID=A0A117NIE5_PICGL|nr:hypothetical protein ABT39_MTgene3075 [Picea glauca]